MWKLYKRSRTISIFSYFMSCIRIYYAQGAMQRLGLAQFKQAWFGAVRE